MVDRLMPEPIFKVSTPAQVEATALRKDNDLIVHLVNHSGKVRLGGYYYPSIEYMPEIRNISVEIKLTDNNQKIISLPAKEEIEYKMENGYAKFVIPSLEYLESVTINNYFS
jgi:hypothetical protein